MTTRSESPTIHAVRTRCVPLLAAFALAVGACAPGTRITNQWNDDEAPGPPLAKVVVLAAKNDATRKRIWEDTFARELQAAGVQAVAAYTIHEGAIVDTVAARQALLDGGYDAAFIVRSQGTQTRTTVIPGTSRIEAVRTVYDPFWHTFRTVYEETRTPDIEETAKLYYNEISVVRPNADPTKRSRLVWSGITESVDPGSSGEASAATAKEVVRDLVRVGLIAPSATGASAP